MKNKDNPDNMDAVIESRKTAMELARKAALLGDKTCAGLLALEKMFWGTPQEYVLSAQDFLDETEEDDMDSF